jgi:hypothetical protein
MTKLRETLGSGASLLAATLYQGNPDRNHKLWNIVSTGVQTVLLFSSTCSFIRIRQTSYRGFSRKMKNKN